MNSMINKISNWTANIASALKQFRLERVLIIVLAGVLVLTTTACSPDSPSVSGTGSYNSRRGQPTGLREYTDRSDGKSRPDVGSYDDNDYRDTASSRAKARDISEKADRNAQKVNSPGEFAESYRQGTPLDQRVRNLSDDVGSAAKQFGEDVSEGTQKNFRNLSNNADKVKQNTQETAKGVQRSSERTARDASEYVQDRAQDASDAVRNRA